LYLKREMGDTFCLACGPYCFTTVVSTLGWYHLRFEIRCEGKMIFWKNKKIILKNNLQYHLQCQNQHLQCHIGVYKLAEKQTKL
jgi:hypothetical protein